eukprot:15453971-Alexandrium_andersonii.AAC.1
MPPKRLKSRSQPIPADVLEQLWLEATTEHEATVFDVGTFMLKDTFDVNAVLAWHPQIMKALDHCTNAVVCWDSVRSSLRNFFMARPRTDPNLKQPAIDHSMSAELCATGFKRLMGALRRSALYDGRRSA